MNDDHRIILGLRFFLGTAQEAVARAEPGGLVLMPAAPALKDIATSSTYRDALLTADVLLTDSAFMVMVWNRLQHDNIKRLSGLTYLRELLNLPSLRQSGNTLWVLPSTESITRTTSWLSTLGFIVATTHLYAAPIYRIDPTQPIDPELLTLIERLSPQHIVLGIGGGTQEPLGVDLKRRLTYLPAIHCVGAAIAFLSGEQAPIPVWADRLYFGWLIRTLHSPRRFTRRYWEARKLATLLRRYRDQLPPLTLPIQ
jgi:N-acetylglucosaminyldiphosphoundecaprenol N-acetyl-beta-D-mannosaminyltransferase